MELEYITLSKGTHIPDGWADISDLFMGQDVDGVSSEMRDAENIRVIQYVGVVKWADLTGK